MKARQVGTFGKQADLNAIDRGRVMHPVWGRAKRSGINGLAGPQLVARGYFSNVMDGLVARRAEKEILAALQRAVARVAGSKRAAA